MTVKCTIQYFKPSGKYYSEGKCEVIAEHMFQVVDCVRKMFESGEQPGLVDGLGMQAYVTTDHPLNVPFIWSRVC